MGNFFDQFDGPAGGSSAVNGNFFDQFDGANAPMTTATPLPSGDPESMVAGMSREQMKNYYMTAKKGDPLADIIGRELSRPMPSESPDDYNKRVGTVTPANSGGVSALYGAGDTLTFGLSDELAGALDWVGGGSYEQGRDRMRAAHSQLSEANPGSYVAGQLAGAVPQAVVTGGGGAVIRAPRAATAFGRAAQTAGGMGRAALTAGASGAAYGFNSGEGGVGNRLTNAAETGAMSAAFAPAASAVASGMGRMINRAKGQSPIWSSDDIENASQSLYRQATQEGAIVKPNTIANVGRRMNAQVINDINYSSDVPGAFTNARQAMDIVKRVFVGREPQPGVSPRAPRPGTAVTIDQPLDGGVRFTGTSTPAWVGGRPTTLEELEVVRRRLTKLAGQTQDNDEARMIFKMRSVLDEAIDGLTPDDMANGSPAAFGTLDEARKLWRVKSDTEWAEQMLERAKARAGQFSVSKTENAIRTEARGTALNPKKMRKLQEPVKAAVEKVANPGIAQNAVRNAGKFAPTSGTMPTLISVFNPAIGLPLMAAGQVAQVASGEMTRKNFRNLQRAIQRTLPQKDVPIPRAEKIAKRAVPFAVPGLLTSEEPFITDANGRQYDKNGNLLQ